MSYVSRVARCVVYDAPEPDDKPLLVSYAASCQCDRLLPFLRPKQSHKWGMIDFEIPVVYGAGLLTAAALLLAALVALCFSLHRGGAFADTPRAAARAIRQFSFTPRGVQSPRAYFAGTPRQRRGF